MKQFVKKQPWVVSLIAVVLIVILVAVVTGGTTRKGDFETWCSTLSEEDKATAEKCLLDMANCVSIANKDIDLCKKLQVELTRDDISAEEFNQDLSDYEYYKVEAKTALDLAQENLDTIRDMGYTGKI